MKYLTLLPILLVVLAGCASDETPTAVPTNDTPAVTEMWVIVDADGTETRFDSEPELWDSEIMARPTAQQATCWHWTFDTGTWWVRHCGYTLSEECFRFEGPTGNLVPCDGSGPGGNW